MANIFSILKANTAFAIGIFFVVFFLLGNIFPEQFWATHDNYFLPGSLPLCLWTIVFLCFVFAFLSKKEVGTIKRRKLLSSPHLVIWLITLGGGILFYSFPIIDDYYGDARIFRSFLHEPVKQLPEDFWSRFFSFSLQPEHGRKGVRLLVSGMAYLAGSSIYDAFRWLGICCGMGFILAWLYAVRYFIQHTSWQIVLSISGLSAPLLLVFFGHVENYSLIYFILIGWLLLFLTQLKTRNKALYGLLFVSLLLFARLHIMLILCLPGLLLAGLYTFGSTKPISQKLLTVQGMLPRILLPLLVMGLLLYFFVFEDHRDPRVMQDFTDIERLFLPLLPPEPPFDRYNLLSFNHLLDYFNAILLWSPVSLFLVSWACIKAPLSTWDKDPVWAILGLTFLLFFATFFMINPLFSMPMEWDLMCFPALLVLVLTLYLVSNIQHLAVPRGLLSIIFALALFTGSSVYVNHHAKPLSQKIETIGRHVYKTYYAHSSTYMLFALNLDSQHYLERKEKIIQDLEPYALPGKDKLYAELLMDDAMMFFSQNNKEGAEIMIGEAIRYYPPISGTFQEFIQAVQQPKP